MFSSHQKNEKIFVDLLNFNPFTDDRDNYDDDAFFQALIKRPNHASKPFKFLEQDDVYPVIMASLLGASKKVIDKMNTAFDVTSKCIVGALLFGDEKAVQHIVAKKGSRVFRSSVFGFSLIHLAIFCELSIEIVAYLIKKCPPEMLWKKAYDKTPLLIACNKSAPVEVIELLLSGFPKSIGVVGENDAFPLHVACGRSTPDTKVVKLLVERWPEVLLRVDADGNTPLHKACQQNTPLEIIKALVEACPRSIRVQNLSHKEPLQVIETSFKKLKAYLSFAVFFVKLMEDDNDRNIRFKIDELKSLVFDVRAMKFFYSYVSFCNRLGLIETEEKKEFIRRGLKCLKRTLSDGCCDDETRRQFNKIAMKGISDSVVPSWHFEEYTFEEQSDSFCGERSLSSESFLSDESFNYFSLGIDETKKRTTQELVNMLNAMKSSFRSNERVKTSSIFLTSILCCFSFSCDGNDPLFPKVVDFSSYEHIEDVIDSYGVDTIQGSFHHGTFMSHMGDDVLESNETCNLFWALGYILGSLNLLLTPDSTPPQNNTRGEIPNVPHHEQTAQLSPATPGRPRPILTQRELSTETSGKPFPILTRISRLEEELSLRAKGSIVMRVSRLALQITEDNVSERSLADQVEMCEKAIFGE